jgi:hypothetical protein
MCAICLRFTKDREGVGSYFTLVILQISLRSYQPDVFFSWIFNLKLDYS